MTISNLRDLFVLQDHKYYPLDGSLRPNDEEKCNLSEHMINVPVHKNVAETDVKYNEEIDFCWKKCENVSCNYYRVSKIHQILTESFKK